MEVISPEWGYLNPPFEFFPNISSSLVLSLFFKEVVLVSIGSILEAAMLFINAGYLKF